MLMLTVAERRAIVAAAIKVDPNRSDRSVASTTGASREMIAAIRSEMVRDGLVVARETITGSDGKCYPIGERPDRPNLLDIQRVQPGTVPTPVVAILTRSVLAISGQFDRAAWQSADDMTRRTFRLACERLAGAVRRLDDGRAERSVE